MTPSENPLHQLLPLVVRMTDPNVDAVESDRQLLTRFTEQHDEKAFARLVERHGAMVLGVARRILARHHDAEDVFQAAFLVLARRAVSIREHQNLAGWLHGVACRLSWKMRERNGSRQLRDRREPAMRSLSQPDPEASDELRELLDRELQRLPSSYRLPLILCYLEGKSRAEAAVQMDISEDTVRGRLARGRDALRRRLMRHGIGISTTALLLLLEQEMLGAPVPAALAASTVRGATAMLYGQPTDGLLSPAARSLADTSLTSFRLTLTTILLTTSLLGLTIGLITLNGISPSLVSASEAVLPEEKPVPPTTEKLTSLAIRKWKAIGPFGDAQLKDGPFIVEPRRAAHNHVNAIFYGATYPPDTVIDLDARYKGELTRDINGRVHEITWVEIATDSTLCEYPERDKLPRVPQRADGGGSQVGLSFFSSWVHAPTETRLLAEFPAYADLLKDSSKVCSSTRVLLNRDRVEHYATHPYNRYTHQPKQRQEIVLKKGWNHFYGRVWSSFGGVRMAVVLHAKDNELQSLTVSADPPKEVGRRFLPTGDALRP